LKNTRSFCATLYNSKTPTREVFTDLTLFMATKLYVASMPCHLVAWNSWSDVF